MKAFNDIAIMKLVRPVKFGPWIQPVCLPNPGEIVPEGTPAIAHGWGNKEGNVNFERLCFTTMRKILLENGSSPDVLQQVSLPVITTQSCAETFKKNGYPLVLNPEIMLCAGFPEGGKDTCQVIDRKTC